MLTIIVDGVMDLAEWNGNLGAAPNFTGIKAPLNTLYTGGLNMVNFANRHSDIIRAQGWKVAKHVADIFSTLLRTGQLTYLIMAANKDEDIKNEYANVHVGTAAAYVST